MSLASINRGDIFLVNLEPVMGSEQGKIRPCLVVQSNILNQFSPNTIVVPITSTIPDKNYPHIVIISSENSGLKNESTVLCNQVRVISAKDRLLRKVGSLNNEIMRKVDSALKISLGLE